MQSVIGGNIVSEHFRKKVFVQIFDFMFRVPFWVEIILMDSFYWKRSDKGATSALLLNSSLFKVMLCDVFVGSAGQWVDW